MIKIILLKLALGLKIQNGIGKINMKVISIMNVYDHIVQLHCCSY